MLYIVPTPIGNLLDITYRALEVLRGVHCIATEDTRRIKVLLRFFSIRSVSLHVFHQYNECKNTPILIEKMQSGWNVALVSDAGTPLISDPGYRLVQSCHKLGIQVVPLPGACAAITALCGSGLPTNRFCFEGFFPSRRSVRLDLLKSLLNESRTLVFYDVKHRILDTLEDIINIFGPERYVVLARELTKIWESIYGAPAKKLLFWIKEDHIRIRGEIVLVISGNNNVKKHEFSPKIFETMKLLALELPLKKVVRLVGDMYNMRKNLLYNAYIHYTRNINDDNK